MSLGDPYASIVELEARLGSSDDGTFTALLDAASRRVEDFTGRQFNQATTATIRVFRPVDPERLPVDDFYTLTDFQVVVGTTTLDSDDVDHRPWDGIVNGQTGWPYFDLFRVGGFWPYSRRAKIQVTAIWGWAAVPEAIVQATLDVAASMSTGGGSESGIVQETIDDYSVTYGSSTPGFVGSVPAELVKAVAYRRKRFGVA
jgi:hypothetical protein